MLGFSRNDNRRADGEHVSADGSGGHKRWGRPEKVSMETSSASERGRGEGAVRAGSPGNEDTERAENIDRSGIPVRPVRLDYRSFSSVAAEVKRGVRKSGSLAKLGRNRWSDGPKDLRTRDG